MVKRIYKDLVNEYQYFNSWKSEESFPIKTIDGAELSQFKIIEYVFEGMLSNRTQQSFNELIVNFKEEIIKILENNKMNNYLFSTENGSSTITRIRSYKGLIDKYKIDKSKFIQKEYILNINESKIAFVAILNKSSFDYLSTFLFDSTSSFIISTNSNYLNELFLDDVTAVLNMNGWTHINMLNVMLKFCIKGDIVYRIGGNDGEDYWSLQEML